jgi:hypothetical protein
LLLAVMPASAKVLAEGKPSGGFYWQKIEDKNGRVRFACRATGDAKFQKNASCEKAGAVKP